MFARGERIGGRYEVAALLGSGGMGAVYCVRDLESDDVVRAVKVILPHLASEPETRRRFRREGAIARSLRHPNVVQTFAFEESGSDAFLCMEYLEGETLAERLEREGTLSPAEGCRIVGEVLKGLAFAHQTTVHRDIKPQNIFLCRSGQTKILDFGVARALDSESFTKTSEQLGSAFYVAPEQFRGEASTAQSDLYSVGVVLYQCLVGQPPLGAFGSPCELGVGIPERLDRLIVELLAPRPEARPQSAAEVLEWLDSMPADKLGQVRFDGTRGDAEYLEHQSLSGLLRDIQPHRGSPPGIGLAEVPRHRGAQRVFASLAVVMLCVFGVLLVLRGGVGAFARTGFVSTREAPATVSQPTLPGTSRAELNSAIESMVFVDIPPGTFRMGNDDHGGDPNERPVRRITISDGFQMGKYEVTQGEWSSVMGINPSTVVGDRLPVNNISWNDAREFIGKLNGLGMGTYRLPTEAEWEYACRSGTMTRYYFGDEGAWDQLPNYAWYATNSSGLLRPIGEKLPNSWGLHDMYGNVREWCADFYGAYAGEDLEDPQGPAVGRDRVYRGGSIGNNGNGATSAARHGQAPDVAYPWNGLRLVREDIP